MDEEISKQVQSAIAPLAQVVHEVKTDVKELRKEGRQTAVDIAGIHQEFKRLNGSVKRHETAISGNTRWRYVTFGAVVLLGFLLEFYVDIL